MPTVEWKGGMAFEATGEGGKSFIMDATPDHGGQALGPTPLETLLSTVAACSAMDVISILQKKHQHVTSYRIEVNHVRAPEGAFPRPITSIEVVHFVTGEALDEAAVSHAVELSDEKYCSVIATLRLGPEVQSSWKIEENVSVPLLPV